MAVLKSAGRQLDKSQAATNTSGCTAGPAVPTFKVTSSLWPDRQRLVKSLSIPAASNPTGNEGRRDRMLHAFAAVVLPCPRGWRHIVR